MLARSGAHTLLLNTQVVNDAASATEGAHAICILTEWECFKHYDYVATFQKMSKPAFIFDGRNVLDHDKLREVCACVKVCMKSVYEQLWRGVGESQFQGPEDLARTRAMLRAALEDFAACQRPNHDFYVSPDHPFLCCRNSGRLECVLI